MMYSYDIFDTVITRKTANPHGIFALMQEKLTALGDGLPEEVKKNFFELRIQGERLARFSYCKKDREEITLGLIYQAINSTGMLTPSMVGKLMELEIETELENVIPVPAVVEEVREHLDKNDDVIFISDMYLDKKTVKKLLGAANARFEKIPLYLSSDIGKTKSSGNLFRYIQEERGIRYTDWVHTGDNILSDITVPGKLGMKGLRVYENMLLPIEKAVLKGSGDDASLQLLVGISKNARMLRRLNKIESVGASLSGFLLGAYVQWIINDAVRRGIKTLYFIARDGYVLKKAADIFIEQMGYKISTEYIYGSRKAWRMPAHISEDMDILELCYTSTPEFLRDLESAAEIFELSFSEFLKFLPEGIKGRNCRLSRIDVDVLFRYLAGSKNFKNRLIEENRKKRESVTAYLKQEINLREEQLAFVEVGGTGYTQKCLGHILSDLYDGRVGTYYFQLYSLKEGKDCFYNFVPDDFHMKDAIEPLCRAPHGQTLGYIRKGARMEPVLEKKEDLSFYKDAYEKYVRGFLAYAETYMDYYKELFTKPVNRKMIRKCWDYYTHANDEDILGFVGEIPFGVTGKENKNLVYAPRLNKQEIKEIFYSYSTEPASRRYRGASLNMSVLRMNEEERRLMVQYQEQAARAVKEHTEKMENRYDSDTFVRIPDGRYPDGSKIVIYGAGKFGKAFYYQAKRRMRYQIVSWTDKQYRRYIEEGYSVIPPSHLTDMEFDVVLVAVLERTLKNRIEEELTKLGIPVEKIDWISPEELVKGYGNG